MDIRLLTGGTVWTKENERKHLAQGRTEAIRAGGGRLETPRDREEEPGGKAAEQEDRDGT